MMAACARCSGTGGRVYPAPAVRARRRVETPPGAQAQVDWTPFPAVIVGDEAVDLVALHMVLSWSRQEAIAWARSKDMLAWLGCHTACFARLGGVPATLRVDNEKTAIVRGAGAWGTINPSYRRYAGAQGQGRAPGARPSPYGRSFRDMAPSGEHGGRGGLRADELRSRRRIPVRLVP
jgi:hypothetical protein